MSGAPADTIVGISSARGPGLRGIVRLSGAGAIALVDERFQATAARDDVAAVRSSGAFAGSLSLTLGPAGSLPVELLVFRGPRTYTREDVVEIHTIGSPPLLDALVRELCAAGARLADPGEFTRRAFENGRIDLTQVEAVLELIRASSEAEADQAFGRYDGAFGRRLGAIRSDLLGMASRVETHLDFSDQDIDLVDREALQQEVERAASELRSIAGEAQPGGLVAEGKRVLLLGVPNAGKSSLFNVLVEGGRAVVSDIAGTTLDAVEGVTDFGGAPAVLIDAPGLRDDIADELEQSAADRARARLAAVDLVVVVVDASRQLPADLARVVSMIGARPCVVALHQADRERVVTEDQLGAVFPSGVPELVATSAVTGEGIEDLRRVVSFHLVSVQVAPEAGTVCPNARQAVLLEEACAALARVESTGAELPFELVALELREAALRLGGLTGEDFIEGLLDRIFADFCIGK